MKQGSGLTQFFQETLLNQYNYNKSSLQILHTYGNDIIMDIYIRRSPILSMINSIVKPLNNINYDKYFHLDIIINNKIKIEKNERINISIDMRINRNEVSYYQLYNVPNIKINDFLFNCKYNMGDELYFTYHPFNNNCQIFIMSLLKYNGINDLNAQNFIYQDVNYIINNYKTLVKGSKFLTDVAGRFNSLWN